MKFLYAPLMPHSGTPAYEMPQILFGANGAVLRLEREDPVLTFIGSVVNLYESSRA